MARTVNNALRWTADGTKVFLHILDGLDAAAFSANSLLPSWSRKHVAAHVAANADALGNLVHWAATGIETPMYASPQERAAGITRGTTMSADKLTAWARGSADALTEAMTALTSEQWHHPVVTAQGRTVPATEIPWLRAREVWVHAVDLACGVTFADLPRDLLAALTEDIQRKREIHTLPEGPQSDVAAWLAGRPHALGGPPELGPWL